MAVTLRSLNARDQIILPLSCLTREGWQADRLDGESSTIIIMTTIKIAKTEQAIPRT